MSNRLALVALTALLVGCPGPSPKKTFDGPQVQELWLTTGLPDTSDADPFSRPSPSLYDVMRHVERATDDADAKGMFLRVGTMAGAWGRVEDLIESFSAFRDKGRPVHCHFQTTDNVGYLLMARVCDRISMSPAGTLDLVGPAAQLFFFKDLLNTIGVEAEILHMGRYKGAGDMFVRDDPSPEALESFDELLNGIEATLLSAVGSRIEADDKAARAIIDQGPFVSEAAREAKLVDDVGFDDEAREHARKAADVQRVQKVKLMDQPTQLTVGDVLDSLSGKRKSKSTTGRRIALAFVRGNIVEADGTERGRATSGPFVKALRRMANDDQIKAVVLRVNSPGGSALASDRMWHAVRKAASRKPVIVSIGDMAASGGYYIASAGHEIFAQPNSLVGSIGVVGGKFNAEKLADKLGINATVLSRGKNAAWSIPTRGFTDSERDAFEAMLRNTYYRFIRRVATGRGMPKDKVLAAAGGRVMSARRGHELGLVDTLGGLGQALSRARERAKVGKSIPVEIWPAEKDWLQAASELLGGDPDASLTQATERAITTLGVPVEHGAAFAALLIEQDVAALSPFAFVVR